VPVAVRNSDQGLDLRLRNAAAQTCQHFSRRHGGGHPAFFGCHALGARACGASRAGPECVRLRPHPHSVRGQVPRARTREGAIGPSLAGGQLGRRPQVIGVIGVSDPYRLLAPLAVSRVKAAVAQNLEELRRILEAEERARSEIG
jgi:hypothetical protein